MKTPKQARKDIKAMKALMDEFPAASASPYLLGWVQGVRAAYGHIFRNLESPQEILQAFIRISNFRSRRTHRRMP